MGDRLRIALVEPYLGGSHEAWAQGYRSAAHHYVEIISHPARFWKWRMHGAYLTLAAAYRDIVARDGPFDVILASNMLHVPAFLGAAGGAASGVATVVYFHENQLTYPLSEGETPDDAYAMINWTSAAVADLVLFNSAFHRDAFFAAAVALLRRFPDERHSRFLNDVRERSEVLPVGVDLRRLDGVVPSTIDAPVILWNHRWEYDKGPGAFAAAMTGLAREGRDFRVVITGERFVGEPAEFEALRSALGRRLAHAGYVEDVEYVRLVAAADIVVSTALQENFGVAITEAMYVGAFPLLPDRLVYPERMPPRFHDRCLYADEGLSDGVSWALDHPKDRASISASLRDDMRRFDWSEMAPRYDDVLARVAR